MKLRPFTLLFAFFLVVMFFVRSWQLGTNPAGFFCDEASAGYDAYLILHTGRDRHGEFLPLFFKGFNFDNLSPYHVYFNIPFVAILGMNETAIRLTPVLGGLIELVVFYFLLKEFLPKSFAFLGVAMLSVSPWHFHIGRIHMADYYIWSLLTTTACLFLVKAYKYGQFRQYALAGIFFALSSYGYVPSRLFNPIFFSLLVVFLFCQKRVKGALLMIVVFLVFLWPHIHFHLTDPHSLQRIKDTVGVDIRQQEQQENTSQFSSQRFLVKYLAHYSDLFLYEKGDTDFPGQFIRRHSIAGLGLMYPYQKWLVIAGFLWLIYEMVKRKKYAGFFIFLLLVLFPFPDSLTLDGTPSATRSYIGIVPFQTLIAFGWYGIYEVTRRRWPVWVKTSRFVFLSLATFLFVTSLFVLLVHVNNNPQTTSDYWGWQFGPRDVMAYFKEHSHEYDELYLQGEFNAAEIFLAFYDPERTCRGCLIGAPGDRFDVSKKQLFAVTPTYLRDFPFPGKIVHEVVYPNGNVAFYLVGH